MNTTGTNTKTGIYKCCLACDKSFYVEPNRIPTAKYCSVVCHNKELSKRNIGRKLSKETRDKIGKANSLPLVALTCIGCGSPFVVKNQHSYRKYCNKKCSTTTKTPWNKGKSLSPEHLAKITGKNANNWQGGISTENEIIRHRKEIRLWRKACMERDDFTCQKTGVRGGYLQVHHINNFADFPELRTSLSNGITLSKESHLEFHKLYGKRNNTREQLLDYLNTK